MFFRMYVHVRVIHCVRLHYHIILVLCCKQASLI